MNQIAIAIALLCAGLAGTGLLYLLFRPEPERKPEGPRERAPEWHSADDPGIAGLTTERQAAALARHHLSAIASVGMDYSAIENRIYDLSGIATTTPVAEEPAMDRKPKFEVYKAKKGYRWRLLSANGRTLCSGESHTRARDAVRAARTVIETAAIADVVVKS